MGATVLGLMSGTSADGVDAVLARFDGAPRQPTWRKGRGFLYQQRSGWHCAKR